MEFVFHGLTPEQIAERRKGIGGSDAPRIMSGDWLTLWQEKTGRREPEDLSNSLPVQLGIYTEPFNAHWFERQTGFPVARGETVKGQVRVHPVLPFMRANLDGLTTLGSGKVATWQGKHTNPFGSPTEILERTYPQLQHEMAVAGLEVSALSVLYGNSKWDWFEVERDLDYTAELMAREEEFWSYVVENREPPSVAAVRAQVPVDELKTVMMDGNNQWADLAATYIETLPQRKACDAAEAALKAMVETDVGFAFGHGIVITRAKNGNLSLRAPTAKDRKRIEEFLSAADDLEVLA